MTPLEIDRLLYSFVLETGCSFIRFGLCRLNVQGTEEDPVIGSIRDVNGELYENQNHIGICILGWIRDLIKLEHLATTRAKILRLCCNKFYDTFIKSPNCFKDYEGPAQVYMIALKEKSFLKCLTKVSNPLYPVNTVYATVYHHLQEISYPGTISFCNNRQKIGLLSTSRLMSGTHSARQEETKGYMNDFDQKCFNYMMEFANNHNLPKLTPYVLQTQKAIMI